MHFSDPTMMTCTLFLGPPMKLEYLSDLAPDVAMTQSVYLEKGIAKAYYQCPTYGGFFDYGNMVTRLYNVISWRDCGKVSIRNTEQ